MKRILLLAFAGVLAAIVAGCGGGGGGGGPIIEPPPPTQYGGAAHLLDENCAYIVGVITTRHGSSAEAETVAYQRCETEAANQAAGAPRDGCYATSFSQCSAVAVGYNGNRDCRVRTRAAGSRTSAVSSALQACGSGFGAECEVLVSGCASGTAPPVGVWTPPPRTNRPPTTVGNIPDQTVEVGSSETVNASSYFSDPDGDSLTYVSASSESSIVTVSTLGNTVTLQGVSAGTATVRVTATDPGGYSATQDFVMEVVEEGEENRPPERMGGLSTQVVLEGETIVLNMSPYFIDPDGDVLTYTVVSNTMPNPVSLSISNGGFLTIEGVYVESAFITVTATDPDGLSVTQGFLVEVHPSNYPPERAGSFDEVFLTVGDTYTEDVTPFFSDPDGDALTYTAYSDDVTVATVSISPRGILTVRAVGAGRASVTVTATDPSGLSVNNGFNVTVSRPIQRDLLEDFDVRIPSSCEQEVEVCVQDYSCEDNDQLRISVNGNAIFSGTITNDWQCQTVPVRAGSNSVEVYTFNIGDDNLILACGGDPSQNANSGRLRIRAGSDTRQQSWTLPGQANSSATMNVTIGPAGGACTPGSASRNNRPIVQSPIASLDLDEGENWTYSLDSVFSDPDGDALEFSATSNSTQHVTVGVSGNQLTVTAVQGFTSGVVTITVTARDPGGLSASESFTVEVTRRVVSAPPAEDCVILEDLRVTHSGGSVCSSYPGATSWYRAEFRNTCSEPVFVRWIQKEFARLGSHSAARIGPYDTYPLEMICPSGRAEVRWCTQWDDSQRQIDSGYRTCYEADQPRW